MATETTRKQPGAEPCPYCGGMFSRCYGASKKHRNACAPKTLEQLKERAKDMGWIADEMPESVWIWSAQGSVLAFTRIDASPLDNPFSRVFREARKATEEPAPQEVADE
jgi:hypothetical protein